MKSKIFTTISLALFLFTANQAYSSDSTYCEANKVAAQQAATATRVADAGAVATGTATACGGLLWLFGWFDFGASAALCAVATSSSAIIYSNSDLVADRALEAYQNHRDPECTA